MQAGSITGIRMPLCVCKSPTRAIATWITNEVSCRIVFHLRGNHLGRLLLLMSRVCFPPVATVRSLSPRTRGRHDEGNGTLFCQMSKQKQSDSKAAACPRPEFLGSEKVEGYIAHTTHKVVNLLVFWRVSMHCLFYL